MNNQQGHGGSDRPASPRRQRGRARLHASMSATGGRQAPEPFSTWVQEHGQMGLRSFLGLLAVYFGVLYLPELWGSTIQIRYGRIIVLPPVVLAYVALLYVKYRRDRRAR